MECYKHPKITEINNDGALRFKAGEWRIENPIVSNIE